MGNRVWITVAVVVAISLPTRTFAFGRYFVTDLGSLPGGATTVSAADINSRGQVVGQNYRGPGPIFHGFLWSPATPNGITGSMVELPPPASGGTAVNDFGQVTGLAGPSPRIFLWTPETANGTTGGITTISFGDFPGISFPGGINATGQIAGWFGDSRAPRAFLWTPTTPNSPTGSFVELGYLPGRTGSSEARDINALGQVAGSSRTAELVIGPQPRWHAFLWTPNSPNGPAGSMIDLGDLPGGVDESIAHAVNARGQVAGVCSTDVGPRAFLWSPSTTNGTTGSMVDLGALPGEVEFSAAEDINVHGLVVGNSGPPASTRAFLWTPDSPNASTGKMIDLNDLLEPNSGRFWTLRSATAINDRGQIVGTGLLGDSQRALLLTPVPEPSTITFVATGALLLNCFIRRAASRELAGNG